MGEKTTATQRVTSGWETEVGKRAKAVERPKGVQRVPIQEQSRTVERTPTKDSEMPTQDQILSRIQEKAEEALNFENEVLIPHLDFEHVQEFLKAGVTAEEWNREECIPPLKEAKMYMENFGWPKAIGHRGISASRTVQKMAAWAFLMDDAKAMSIIETSAYPMYGVPVLLKLYSYFEKKLLLLQCFQPSLPDLAPRSLLLCRSCVSRLRL